MRKIAIILFLALFITGCIDLGFEGEIRFIDTVAVSPTGQIALCLDEEGQFFWAGEDTEVYLTNHKGRFFTRVTENEVVNSSVAWSDDGRYLLYTEQDKDVWRLNLYSVSDQESTNLLQEMDRIALPSFSCDVRNIAYMVFPDEDTPTGHLNIYERESSSIYTLTESAYYDYKWAPDTRKIVFVNVTDDFEEVFQGRLIIKDIRDFTEEIVFNGYFSKERNAVDVAGDGETIIFNASDEESGEMGIYLYNIKKETLVKWSGPEGYEFRLPTSSIGGYILAHVKGQEDEWAGQLYLVTLDKRIIEVPGWPVWVKEPFVVYLDLYEGEILVLNLDTGEIVNLTERYEQTKD